jgi:glyoxylate reductase
MTHLVLTTRPLPFPSIEAAGEPVEFRVFDAAAPMDGARALISTSLDVVDAAMIARLPTSVGLIANLGIGVDKIDLAAARARNIIVTNTPNVVEDTADYAFALMLDACRRVSWNDRFVRAGDWKALSQMAAMGLRVHGKTLGLVGFGPIAQAVARRANGFNMKILYWNRSAKPDAERETGAERIEDLRKLLAAADIVSVHVALTPETQRLIGMDAFAAMKPGAVFINTGRGQLVDEAALIEALQSGRLAAAGLDVFENEPHAPDALRRMDQVVLAPHVGSATNECRMEMGMTALSNLIAFLSTGAGVNVVTG